MKNKIDENVINCCKIVKELYETEECSVGGYGHIVFDDGNLEDENILWCIEEAKKNEWNFNNDILKINLLALEEILKLSYLERHYVYYCYDIY